MTINPDQTVKFPPMHRLQWEEAQQKDVILYPEGMVEPWATPFCPPLLSAKIEPCRVGNSLLPTAFIGKWWANDKAVYPPYTAPRKNR